MLNLAPAPLSPGPARGRPRLRADPPGNPLNVIGAALALIVLGVILLFLVPWAGIAAGIAGIVLFVLFLLGFGRRATAGGP